jgi:hypothetical protein
MPFKKIISVNCENHIKYTNILCGQNVGFVNITAVARKVQ